MSLNRNSAQVCIWDQQKLPIYVSSQVQLTSEDWLVRRAQECLSMLLPPHCGGLVCLCGWYVTGCAHEMGWRSVEVCVRFADYHGIFQARSWVSSRLR